jgi:hypothetical protein
MLRVWDHMKFQRGQPKLNAQGQIELERRFVKPVGPWLEKKLIPLPKAEKEKIKRRKQKSGLPARLHLSPCKPAGAPGQPRAPQPDSPRAAAPQRDASDGNSDSEAAREQRAADSTNPPLFSRPECSPGPDTAQIPLPGGPPVAAAGANAVRSEALPTPSSTLAVADSPAPAAAGADPPSAGHAGAASAASKPRFPPNDPTTPANSGGCPCPPTPGQAASLASDPGQLNAGLSPSGERTKAQAATIEDMAEAAGPPAPPRTLDSTLGVYWQSVGGTRERSRRAKAEAGRTGEGSSAGSGGKARPRAHSPSGADPTPHPALPAKQRAFSRPVGNLSRAGLVEKQRQLFVVRAWRDKIPASEGPAQTRLCACALCGQTGGGPESAEGRLLPVDVFEPGGRWVHANCALWASAVTLAESKSLTGVQNFFSALEDSRREACAYCGLLSASVACSGVLKGKKGEEKRCPVRFHLGCGLQHGAVLVRPRVAMCREHAGICERERAGKKLQRDKGLARYVATAGRDKGGKDKAAFAAGEGARGGVLDCARRLVLVRALRSKDELLYMWRDHPFVLSAPGCPSPKSASLRDSESEYEDTDFNQVNAAGARDGRPVVCERVPGELSSSASIAPSALEPAPLAADPSAALHLPAPVTAAGLSASAARPDTRDTSECGHHGAGRDASRGRGAAPGSERKRNEQAPPFRQPARVCLRVGALTVYSLGLIDPHNPRFHTKRHLYPAGFCATRLFWSYIKPAQRCLYLCRILHFSPPPSSCSSRDPAPPGKLASRGLPPILPAVPVFELVCEDDPARPIYGRSALEAWTQLLRRLPDCQSWRRETLSTLGNVFPSGPFPESPLAVWRAATRPAALVGGIHTCTTHRNLHTHTHTHTCTHTHTHTVAPVLKIWVRHLHSTRMSHTP